MLRTLAVLSATGIAALSIAPLAHADRAPTKSERRALAKAAGGPTRCLKIRVSTVSTRYAAVTVDHSSGGACDALGDGTQVYRRKGKRRPWRSVNGSSDCSRPTGTPRGVWRDLTPAYCGESARVTSP